LVGYALASDACNRISAGRAAAGDGRVVDAGRDLAGWDVGSFVGAVDVHFAPDHLIDFAVAVVVDTIAGVGGARKDRRIGVVAVDVTETRFETSRARALLIGHALPKAVTIEIPTPFGAAVLAHAATAYCRTITVDFA
jgi:hypothetical protein